MTEPEDLVRFSPYDMFREITIKGSYAEAVDALPGDRTVHKIIIECWP